MSGIIFALFIPHQRDNCQQVRVAFTTFTIYKIFNLQNKHYEIFLNIKLKKCR